MGLLNYSTTVAAEKSIAEIQKRLVAFGARSFAVLYDGSRRPEAVAFEAETPYGLRAFRLDAKLPSVAAVLARQAKARKIPPRLATTDQAARVAWRIVVEKVKVLLAEVQLGVSTLDEVLCANMVWRGDETVYQSIRRQQLAIVGKPSTPA